jgi:hypothetical protein
MDKHGQAAMDKNGQATMDSEAVKLSMVVHYSTDTLTSKIGGGTIISFE